MFRPSRRVAIIGGGIAGQTLCEELLERDPDVGVTLICAEDRLPYDRVRLSELLLADDDPASLQLRPEEWYADHGVEVLLGCRVTSLDPDRRSVELDGDVLDFDRVAIATGSSPLLPPIKGLDKAGVLCFRDPEDCDAIRRGASEGGRAVVIGGGLLGLEAARGLVGRGMRTTVVHLVDRLMERQLDPGSAGMLLPAMEGLGIDVMLERQAAEILGNGRAEGVRFADGEALDAEMVVVSVGIRPEIGLAERVDIACGRGILVD